MFTNIIIQRPTPSEKKPQNLCLDKGYDYQVIRELLEQWNYIAHIRGHGEGKKSKAEIPGYKARRWVVERTH